MSHSIEVHFEIVQKWQDIVNLLAEIMHVPSAVVCKIQPPDYTHYTVISSSNSIGNPFPVDEIFSLDIGTFCETVIKSREPLLVANGLEDDQWKSAPEMRVGMVSYLGFPVFWPDGRVFGTICVLDNKTNRYSEVYRRLLLQYRDVLQADLRALATVHAELATQRAHLEELFTRVPEAIVLMDGDGRVVRANPEFTKIFGYTEEEVQGRSLNDLIVPEELRAEASEITRERDTRGSVSFETVRIRKDGTRVPVSVIRVPVRFEAEGSPNAEYAIYRDISERKQAEENLRKTQAELAHVARVVTLGELTAAIAHELNQPLGAIVNNNSASLRWLAARNLQEARKSVELAIEDGHRAGEIIRRIRSLALKAPPQKEWLDVNETIREVIALARGEIQRNNIALKTELSEHVPGILADRIELQQVILNLVMNAIEAMGELSDGPRELLLRSGTDESEQVVISVKDSGPGIDPGSLDHLFKAFYTTKPHGMGMGLAISRSIIEAHGGRLWATANHEAGLTFQFVLPTGIEKVS